MTYLRKFLQVLQRLRYISEFRKWQSARELIAQKRDRDAVQILKSLLLPKGDCEIARVQLGNCYFRLRKMDEARLEYACVISSQKKKLSVSASEDDLYILRYAEFYQKVSKLISTTGVDEDVLLSFDDLTSLRPRDRLRFIYLPLPSREELVGR